MVEQYNQLFSLKQNCLNHIIDNFEIFNDAFVNLSSDETLLRRNLTYLQRVFTPYIINVLHRKRLLKDRYLSFLINEHLKELETGKFTSNHCSLKAIEDRIDVVGHGLMKVSLSYSWKFVDYLIWLLPNIEVLSFYHCNDAVLENISLYCCKLSQLYIENSSSVTQEGLKLLCKRKACQSECLIKVLSMENLKVSDSAIIHLLRNMPFLEVLLHIDLLKILYKMHKDDLKNNTLTNVKKYNLTKIDILYDSDITEMSDALKVLIVVCPNIKAIRIKHSISEIKFDLFSGFLNLETLVIENFKRSYYQSTLLTKQCNSFNTFIMSHGSNLKVLHISNIDISVFDLIKSCPKLRCLELFEIGFQSLETISEKESITLKNLNTLTLKELNFSEQCVAESVKKILLCSPSLNDVLFTECMFKDSKIVTDLEMYYTNCAVEFFEFDYCDDVKLDMLQGIILNCSTLKALIIEQCENISCRNVDSLNKLRNITNSFVDIVFRKYTSYYAGGDDDV